jgi:DNA-binding MarR family transcriptional regulator
MKPFQPIREKHDGALGDRNSVRVWLRLLSCTDAIEKEVQRRFAERGTTLPRFDMMATLNRYPDGLTMGALSEAMLVTNGNVTQIAKALVRDGFIELRKAPGDRRSSIASLTPEGKQHFQRLARAHSDWIEQMVGSLGFTHRERLYVALGTLKTSIGAAAATRKRR